jgi:hypothetical protein
MVGQCPDTVRVGETFSLLVRIGVSEGGAELKSFTVPAGGLDILLVLHAPGLRVLGGERQTLRVPAEGDSEPSMFELVADSPGARKISITAWQDGSYLGELQVELTAFADAPASRPQSVRAELSREIVDGAVTLVVRYDPARNAYRFQFHDIDNPREEVHALSNPPGPLVEELVNELDRLAEGRTGYSAGETRDYHHRRWGRGALGAALSDGSRARRGIPGRAVPGDPRLVRPAAVGALAATPPGPVRAAPGLTRGRGR